MYPMTISFQIDNADQLLLFAQVLGMAKQQGIATPTPQTATTVETPSASAAPATKKPPKPVASTPTDTDDKKGETVDRQTVSKLAISTVAKGKKQEVVDLLAKYGANAVTGDPEKQKVGVPDDKLAEFYAGLQALAV